MTSKSVILAIFAPKLLLKTSSIFNLKHCSVVFVSDVATLRKKRNFAAVKRHNHEQQPTNNQSRDTYVPRVNEDYITHVQQEIGKR